MMNKTNVDRHLIAILAFSLLVNVGFAMKVHKLNGILTPAPPEHLAIGSRVASLDALDLSGSARHLVFATFDRPVVLYAFTPTCTWCAKNLDNIKKIYEVRHPDYAFVGVSLSADDVPSYVSRTAFPLEVIKQPSPESLKRFHFNETPETIVIDRSGTVRQVWSGAYGVMTCRKIEQFFHMPTGSLSPVS